METMRWCRRCEKDRPVADFVFTRRVCEDCFKAIVRGEVFTLTKNEATDIMLRLEAGESLAMIVGKVARANGNLIPKNAFEKHCLIHVRWGKKAMALAKANASKRIGDAARKMFAAITHCRNGHEFTPENTRMDRGKWRICLTCQRINQKKGRWTPEQLATVVDCITNKGMTMAEVCNRRGDRPRMIKFEALALALKQDPELNELVRRHSALNYEAKQRAIHGRWDSKASGFMSASEISALITEHPEWTSKQAAEATGRDVRYIYSLANAKGLKLTRIVSPRAPARPKLIARPKSLVVNRGPALTGVIAGQPNEIFTTINEVVPRHIEFERRKMVISDMIAAVLEGELSLSDAKGAYPRFLSASYREYAFKAFGSLQAPVSLNYPISFEGKTSLIEQLPSESGLYSEESVYA